MIFFMCALVISVITGAIFASALVALIVFLLCYAIRFIGYIASSDCSGFSCFSSDSSSSDSGSSDSGFGGSDSFSGGGSGD